MTDWVIATSDWEWFDVSKISWLWSIVRSNRYHETSLTQTSGDVRSFQTPHIMDTYFVFLLSTYIWWTDLNGNSRIHLSFHGKIERKGKKNTSLDQKIWRKKDLRHVSRKSIEDQYWSWWMRTWMWIRISKDHSPFQKCSFLWLRSESYVFIESTSKRLQSMNLEPDSFDISDSQIVISRKVISKSKVCLSDYRDRWYIREFMM